MEALLTGLLANVVAPLVGAFVVAGGSYALGMLKKKTDLAAGKQALDTVDQVFGAVVGNLTQTTVQALKEKSADGKLTKEEAAQVKVQALEQGSALLTQAVQIAAGKIVPHLNTYAFKKIEDLVREQKKGS